jgi:hypothetical protein
MSDRDHPWEDDFAWSAGRTVRGALWRIGVSVVAPVAWLSVTLLYLGFWAKGLTLGQDVIVAVVSVLTLFGFLVTLWLSFGLRTVRRWADW